MPSYVDNFYKHLKRKGYAPKYEKAGIYCIKIDKDIVYIGKSKNMLRRVAEHYVNIKKQNECKYRILAEANRKGHSINFDVLYCAQETAYKAIEEEIGQKEGEYIRQHKPILNSQIPHEDDWHKFDVVEIDVKTILEQL